MNYPAIICGVSGLSEIFCFRKQEFRSHSKLAYNFWGKGEMWDHLPEKCFKISKIVRRTSLGGS